MNTFRLAVSLAAVSLTAMVSCAPSPDNSEVPIHLVALPASVSIRPAPDTGSTTIALSCGCGFPMTFTAVGPDSAIIHYQPQDAITDTLTTHTVRFFAAAAASAGTYEADYIASAHDDYGNTELYDTVHVTLTIP